MTTYIIRRFIQGLIVLVLATFVIYSILVVTPGGPADQIAEMKATSTSNKPVNAALLEALMKAYKLDSPYPINYLRWLFDPSDTSQLDPNDNTREVQKGIRIALGPVVIAGSGALTGDFGTSLAVAKGVNVMKLMGDRVGNTLALTMTALGLSILVAVPIGIISAIRQYSRLDYAVTGFSFVGLSMPTFWLGLMLVIFLAVIPKQIHDSGVTWMPYLPTGFALDSPDQEGNIMNRIYHLILPVTVLAFVNVAGFSRYVRSSMLEVLRQDYVRTAWAKGLAQRNVILRHALRNALIPVITVVTLSLPFLFSGAIATETVFAYPGMGSLFVQAIFKLDVPLIMAFLLIITTLIVLSNILADVLYAVADPRIHYS
jgi:peptide/nickel transport system permease protein